MCAVLVLQYCRDGSHAGCEIERDIRPGPEGPARHANAWLLGTWHRLIFESLLRSLQTKQLRLK